MTFDFEELYQALILDHYRKPRNRGKIEGATRTVELFNPLCGDEIAVDIKIDGDKVSDVRFHGQGCSISQASASMMTELLKGKSAKEAADLVQLFKSMLRGETSPDDAGERIGDLIALKGVAKYPARIKCATLAWNAMLMALEGKAGKATITGE